MPRIPATGLVGEAQRRSHYGSWQRGLHAGRKVPSPLPWKHEHLGPAHQVRNPERRGGIRVPGVDGTQAQSRGQIKRCWWVHVRKVQIYFRQSFNFWLNWTEELFSKKNFHTEQVLISIVIIKRVEWYEFLSNFFVTLCRVLRYISASRIFCFHFHLVDLHRAILFHFHPLLYLASFLTPFSIFHFIFFLLGKLVSMYWCTSGKF